MILHVHCIAIFNKDFFNDERILNDIWQNTMPFWIDFIDKS